MQPGAVGIILAGGRSSRMGTDKALLEIEGESLLVRSTRIVSSVVAEVLIVGRTELPPELAGTPAIEDRYPGTGPLGGIASGLAQVGAEWALVVACDLPFLQADLLRLLLELAPGYDAVVPLTQETFADDRPRRQMSEHERGEHARTAPTNGRVDAGESPSGEDMEGRTRSESSSHENVDHPLHLAKGRAQPTCAVYALSCLPAMQSRLARGQFGLQATLDWLHVRWVREEEIRKVDPACESFLNANTPEQWREMVDRHSSLP